MKIRGYLALTMFGLALLVADPVQRFLVAPWVRFAPSRRRAILTRWQRIMQRAVFWHVGKVGGARLPELPRIPGEPGTLILMNHQSLLDIPVVVGAVEGAYPRIVTRKRYSRWIPLISHMVRLYQYPVVDPTANSAEMKRALVQIRDAARTSDVPLAVFPEGTRTKDGEIGRFRTRGLRIILRQRSWTVWVLVADGFWERAKFKHFSGGMADIDGRVALKGPFAWDDPKADPEPFLERMRGVMVEELARLRAAKPA